MLASFFTTVWFLAGLGVWAVCLERATMLPDGWEMVEEAPDPSTPMRISIALRQANIDRLPAKILSNEILTRDDVELLRRPAHQHISRVTEWLSENCITRAQADGDWLQVSSTVGTVEKLLNATIHRYSFNGGKSVLRTTEYSIPDELTWAIDFVHPIANFMTPEHEVSLAPQLSKQQQQEHQSRQRRKDAPCSLSVTPDCLSKLYGINYSTPDGKSPVRLGIAGFLNEWANYDDMRQSFTDSRPDLIRAGYNFTVELITGGENKQDAGKAGAEASLDIQYAMAVGFPTNVLYYSTGGRGEKLDETGKPITGELNDNEPYLDFFQYIARKPDNELPHVLSLSYADDEYTVPKPYAIRVCNEIGMLTARGVTILSGSGDGGARGGRNATCRSHDGRNKDMTIATFPASCPWVTSVGAVTNEGEPPKGAVFSTGGFSDVFRRPAWQMEAVNGYVKALKGHLHGYYNPRMRATPDVSVVGTMFDIVMNGQDTFVQGTSASTPVMAAMIALINDARLRKGRKALGWLNGRLYSRKVRSTLQDITTGQSTSCAFSDGRTPGGWPATKGWDAITGLGVPNNFDKFMKALVDA
ncbi:hypothetical protein E4U54_003161 [Claviceps lovelessii]|nr:hypothetical protein E4U54_003161 [Claviceps lovelessii]